MAGVQTRRPVPGAARIRCLPDPGLAAGAGRGRRGGEGTGQRINVGDGDVWAMTEEYTPQEKAALVAWHLAHGEGMRTCEVVAMTGLTWRRAYELMCRLSRVIPICQDEAGVWAHEVIVASKYI